MLTQLLQITYVFVCVWTFKILFERIIESVLLQRPLLQKFIKYHLLIYHGQDPKNSIKGIWAYISQIDASQTTF